MKLSLLLSLVAVAVFCASCDSSTRGGAVVGERIVSLAPCWTEMLFELGLGENVVADTVYCVTPEAARALPKVGAWSDVSVEQLLSFSPTCVCLAATHPSRGSLAAAQVPLLALPGQTLEDVIQAIGAIGARFGREEQAGKLVGSIRLRMGILKSTSNLMKPMRAMVVVGRARGEGQLRDVTVAGKDGYFEELLKLVNCRCVPDNLPVAFPALSIEGILALNPDVIIEVAPECAGDGGAAALSDWRATLPQLDAVKGGRVLVFTENFATVPGVRSILFAEKVSERLRPFRQGKSK